MALKPPARPPEQPPGIIPRAIVSAPMVPFETPPVSSRGGLGFGPTRPPKPTASPRRKGR